MKELIERAFEGLVRQNDCVCDDVVNFDLPGRKWAITWEGGVLTVIEKVICQIGTPNSETDHDGYEYTTKKTTKRLPTTLKNLSYLETFIRGLEERSK